MASEIEEWPERSTGMKKWIIAAAASVAAIAAVVAGVVLHRRNQINY